MQFNYWIKNQKLKCTFYCVIYAYDLRAIDGRKERKKKKKNIRRVYVSAQMSLLQLKKLGGDSWTRKKVQREVLLYDYFFFPPPLLFTLRRDFFFSFLSFFHTFFSPRYHFSWSNYVIIMLKFTERNLFKPLGLSPLN